jgi:hypothetical protein
MKSDLILRLPADLVLSTAAVPARAANQPRPGKAEGATAVWTNIARF